MGFFKRWTENSGFMNQVKGRSSHHVPNYRDAPHYAGNLDASLEYFAKTLGISDDFMVRVTKINGKSAACLSMTTISDNHVVEETLRTIHTHDYPKRQQKEFAKYLVDNVLVSAETVLKTNMWELREEVTRGNILLVIENCQAVIVIGATKIEHRAPEQPTVETSSRGALISFVESIDTNIGLVRSYLSTDSLVLRRRRAGVRSRRDIAVMYIHDVVSPIVVDTVMQRIEAIHTDVVTGSSAVEQRISDHPWSLFPITRVTQRIDNVCRELNQGKVVIVVDGDPSVLLVPATVQDFFQTEEDYVHTWWDGTFVRWLRIIALILAVWLPALYISFVDFSPELLPKVLGLQIARSREGVPFPAVIEVFIMQIVVEILREATIRMPRQMGQTIGIVGGLVVGQAAVDAGIVSNILIIVIALTAISVFVSPSYEFTTVTRLGSWAMIISATMVGLYGVVLTTLWIFYELANIKSFGVPYLEPFAGSHVRDVFVDGLFRLPTTILDKRTSHLHPSDETGDADYSMPVKHPQLIKGVEQRTKKRGR